MTTDQPIANELAVALMLTSRVLREIPAPQSFALWQRMCVVIKRAEETLDKFKAAQSPIANEEELLKRAEEAVAFVTEREPIWEPFPSMRGFAKAVAMQALRTRDISPMDERGAVVAWLRGELTVVPRDGPDRALRMGQNDALKLAIDAIERGEHLGHIAPLTTEVEVGRTADAGGLSQAEPVVSAVPASIPRASVPAAFREGWIYLKQQVGIRKHGMTEERAREWATAQAELIDRQRPPGRAPQ